MWPLEHILVMNGEEPPHAITKETIASKAASRRRALARRHGINLVIKWHYINGFRVRVPEVPK